MRKVFIDNLIKRRYRNKNIIDWENNINKTIKFIYDDIEDSFTIINYIKNDVFIKYYNIIFKIKDYNLLECKLGKLLNKYTKNYKIEIGTIYKDDKRDLIIIDREYKNDKTNKSWKWYKYKCNKCGWEEGWMREDHLLKNIGCACCASQITVLGINTIWDTDYWMVKFIGEKIAKTYVRNSKEKIKVTCPDCGEIKKQLISIASIYRTRSIGCYCGDGKPYTEKFIYNMLKQLNIEFETGFSPNWTGKRKYDFYISIINSIIESHGIQHYKESFGKVKSKRKIRNLEEEQENDKIKEKLAKENGVNNYIILDCRYSTLDWIKNSIMNSKLPELLDFKEEDVDWNKCEEFALSNLVKIVCELYKNGITNTSELCKINKLSNTTVLDYLKRGTKIGWCDYQKRSKKGETILI